MTATLTTPTDAWRWWEARRLRYNIGLAIAGWAAWGLFAVEMLMFRPLAEDSVVILTPAIILGQGLVWLVIMGLANILYLLGPISEMVLRPTDTEAYRNRMFGLGFWGSTAVPFLFPATVLTGLLLQIGY
jgi:hypothetical protein